MWVEKYSCLEECAVSFAQYFTMINPHPSLSAAAATNAVSLIFLLYSRRLSNVVGFWLGVTFYGALLPPIRLLWACWFVHMCRHSDPLTLQNRFYENNCIWPFQHFGHPNSLKCMGAKNAPWWFWLTFFSHQKKQSGRMWSQVKNANRTAMSLAALQAARHEFEHKAVFSHLSVFIVVSVSSSKYTNYTFWYNPVYRESNG